MVAVTAVNDAPTLTSFGSSVKTTAEDTSVAISFTELLAAGNESDIDGSVSSFVVKAVSSGTLTINGAAWNATTNNTIDASKAAAWKPAANANGTLGAFTAVAKDNAGAESATAVQAMVAVTPISDKFIFSSLSSLGNTVSPTIIQGFKSVLMTSISSERDVINLSGIDAIAGGLDNAFIFSTPPTQFSATGWTGKIWLSSSSGNTFVNISTNSDSLIEYQIKLVGVETSKVSALDFIL